MPVLDRITRDPNVMGGKPCIRGMRVTVNMIAGIVSHGHSVEELLAEYPYLEREDVLQAVRYATRTWGTVSLFCEGSICFAVFFCCFLVCRFDIPHLPLLALHGTVARWCIDLLLISTAIAICGLFVDKLRNRSIIALALVFPELVVMGLLAGFN